MMNPRHHGWPGALVGAVLWGHIAVGAPAAPQTSSGLPAGAPPDPAPITSLRDPFWPVGFKPSPKAAPVPQKVSPDTTQRWDEAFKQIQVTGLSQNAAGKYVAIIRNVGVVEEGGTIAVSYGGLTYKWRVVKISAEGIVPERIGVYAQN